MHTTTRTTLFGKIIGTAAVLLLAAGLNAPAMTIIDIYQTDFTSADDPAWTEGGNVSAASSDWSAQDQWDTTSVSGTGIADTDTNFTRMINSGGGVTMNAGDTLILQTTMRLESTYVSGNGNVVRWGLTDSIDSGAATPEIGGGLGISGGSNFDLEDQDWGNSTDLGTIGNFFDGPHSGSDWISWELRITKSTTANEFDVVNTFIDLEGASQSALTLEYTITDATRYGAGTLYTIFHAGDFTGRGFTAWSIDDLVVGAIPEPSTALLLGLGGLVMAGMYRRMRTA